MNNYQVVRVFKGDKKPSVVKDNITRAQAMSRVQKDISENPDTSESMLVFDKMPNR